MNPQLYKWLATVIDKSSIDVILQQKSNVVKSPGCAKHFKKVMRAAHGAAMCFPWENTFTFVNPPAKTKDHRMEVFYFGVSLQNRCTPHFFQNRAGLFCFWIAPPLVKQGLASDRGFSGSQNHAYIRFTYSATMYLLCLYNNLRQRATLPFRLGNICGISLCICLRTFQRLRHSAAAR